MLKRGLFSTVAALLIVGVACGGGSTASKSNSSTSSSSPPGSKSSNPSPQAKKAAEDFNAARSKGDSDADAGLSAYHNAYDHQDLDGLKQAMRKLRDVDFEFDKAIRAIDFPADAANERNAYLKTDGDVIADEDKVQDATSIDEFDRLDRATMRVATRRRRAAFDLLRALGSPAPEDLEGTKAPKPRGKVVLQDDFSDKASGWADSAGADNIFGYESGKYVIRNLKKNLGGTSDSHLVGDKANSALTRLDAVSVEVEVTKTKDLTGNVGVLCHADPSKRVAYAAVIDTTGSFTIGKFGGGKFAPLAATTSSGGSLAIHDTLEANRLRLDCTHDGSKMHIALYVNGTLVGEGTDDHPLPPGRIALSAETGQGGCCNEAFFDNITVRDLT